MTRTPYDVPFIEGGYSSATAAVAAAWAASDAALHTALGSTHYAVVAANYAQAAAKLKVKRMSLTRIYGLTSATWAAATTHYRAAPNWAEAGRRAARYARRAHLAHVDRGRRTRT